MSYIDKRKILRMLSCILLLPAFVLAGCERTNNISLSSSFFARAYVSEYYFDEVLKTEEPEIHIDDAADFLYSSICYSPDEITNTTDYGFSAKAAACFNVSKAEVLYSKGIYDKIYPASTTKLLTAYVALKYGNLKDEIVIEEDNAGITIPGAMLCGFKKGDVITLEELLKCLLIFSGNDSAVIIANYISGNVEKFAELMNKEAEGLGATGTHFTNPHGLHDLNHYTTAYDMYLIFNSCIQNEMLLNIMGQQSCVVHYRSAEGEELQLELKSTNLFFHGIQEVPEGFHVYGGKTGETIAAGKCLIMLSENPEGDLLITEVFGVETRELQYCETKELMKILSENIKK